MSKIAIIPARSGSKGLIDKNIKEMNGKPLMAYTIEAAVESNLFDCIHVATDSEKYGKIAKRYGAEVPFYRSMESAVDSASTWGLIKEVLIKYQKRNQYFNTVAVLQPTSPLRNKAHMIEAMDLFESRDANAVIGICRTEHSPIWSNIIGEDCNMKGFMRTEYIGKGRQELPEFYRINGAVYILKPQTLNNLDELYDHKCYGYIMDKYSSIDIDDEIDFLTAELLLKHNK